MTGAAVIDQLFEQCKRDHQRWINGDPGGYGFQTEDATLMGAFGGLVIGGTTATPRQQTRVGQFESGEGEIELIASGVAGNLAWLVMIERASVKFRGRSAPGRWELRVTELFRQAETGWVRIHRHADPLVDFHTLDEVTRFLG